MNYLSQFELTFVSLGLFFGFGLVWVVIGQFDLLWAVLDQFRFPFGLFWLILGRFGLF